MLAENLIVSSADSNNFSFEQLYKFNHSAEEKEDGGTPKTNKGKLKFNKNIEEILEEKDKECELKLKKLLDEHSIESERLRSQNRDLTEEKVQLETKLDRLKSLRSSDYLQQ